MKRVSALAVLVAIPLTILELLFAGSISQLLTWAYMGALALAAIGFGIGGLVTLWRRITGKRLF